MNVQHASKDSVMVFIPSDQPKGAPSIPSTIFTDLQEQRSQTQTLNPQRFTELISYVAEEVVSGRMDQASHPQLLSFGKWATIAIAAVGNIAFIEMSKEFAEFLPYPYNEIVGYALAVGNILAWACFTGIPAVAMYEKLTANLSEDAKKVLESNLPALKKYLIGATSLFVGASSQVVTAVAAYEYNQGLLRYIFPGIIVFSNLGFTAWSLFNTLSLKISSLNLTPEEQSLITAKQQLIGMAKDFESFVVSMEPADIEAFKDSIFDIQKLPSDSEITLKFFLELSKAITGKSSVSIPDNWKTWLTRKGFAGLGIMCGLAALAQCWIGGSMGLGYFYDNEIAKQLFGLFIASCNAYGYMTGGFYSCLSIAELLLNKIYGISTPTLTSKFHPIFDKSSKAFSVITGIFGSAAMAQFSLDYLKSISIPGAIFSGFASCVFSTPTVLKVTQIARSYFFRSKERREYKGREFLIQMAQKLSTALTECPLPRFFSLLKLLQNDPCFKTIIDPKDLDAYERTHLQTPENAISTPLLQSGAFVV